MRVRWALDIEGHMKRLILTCVKTIDGMSRWTEHIGRYLILPMIGVVCYEVVVRRFFNAPTTWAMDILGMLFGVFIIWSGGPSVLARSQVCMDALYNMWKPRTKAIVNSITYTLSMSFCIVLAWQASKYAIQSWQTKELANTILSQPLYHWRVFLAAGTWLLFLQVSSELLKNYWHAFTGEALLPEAASKGVEL